MSGPPVLSVTGLRTTFRGDPGGPPVVAVDGASFRIGAGETLGLVGESGSGKSVTALSIAQLLPEGGRIEAGAIVLGGRDLVGLPERELRAVRGRGVGLVFQEPATALNPVLRVGDQVAEVLVHHEGVGWREARRRAAALFAEVGLDEPERRLRAWPHELSGGQKQRVMIAGALAARPALLLADEPTTALDVTVQAQILALVARLARDRGAACLFISHDLGVVAQVADRVAVMFRGRVVEEGPVAEVLAAPRHPYTRGLLACRPRADRPWARLPTVDDFLVAAPGADGRVEVIPKAPDPERARFLRDGPARPPPDGGPPALEVDDLRVRYPTGQWPFGSTFEAVRGVSFAIPRGRTFGLVGESGCGKTSVGRAILGLLDDVGGRVRFRPARRGGAEPAEVELGALSPAGWRRWRPRLQLVFQDPYASLNPRLTVREALTEPLRAWGVGGDPDARAAALLDEVGLPRAALDRYPHGFSGGQRQRICLARALALEPEVLVCDECVSALDVSVQAQVLNLLRDLQDARGLTLLFVSHDLAVVRFMADEIGVMQAGRLVERGPAAAVYGAPREDYTRALLAGIPRVPAERDPAVSPGPG